MFDWGELFSMHGLVLLTAQAHFSSLKPPVCNVFKKDSHCEKLSGNQEAFLYVSLFLLARGSAGFKASLPSHGADQFDERDPKEARHLSTYFNVLLFALCIGGIVSLILNVGIQFRRGWAWSFGASTIEILLSTLIFALALPLYRIHDAQRTNAIIEIIQVQPLHTLQ
ncbi:hypothetical protein Fmac_004524 [Flemingia macrophylla]|uniref:Uncharacterized protein n=1 Tax=Flemingia macrophylla TaxID=520843 RepID=A0ABD1N571_9FABA